MSATCPAISKSDCASISRPMALRVEESEEATTICISRREKKGTIGGVKTQPTVLAVCQADSTATIAPFLHSTDVLFEFWRFPLRERRGPLNQPALHGDRCHLSSIGSTQPFDQLADVVADGERTAAQLIGDLFVAHALDQ